MQKRLFLLAALALANPALAADNDLADRLAECGSLEQDSARLACYDALRPTAAAAAPEPAVEAVAPVEAVATVEAAEAVEATDVVAAAPAAAAATASVAETDGPQPLTDDVAKATIEPEAKEREEYAATVTSCTKTRTPNRTYFHMENGQIWRQSNSGRLKLHDNSCQFDVVLRKDGFGWVMLIPEDKNRKIRVRRQQ
ncbi:MAG: hypothetical protein AAFN78_04630 [Pseudomonadota bacterium]